MLEIAFKLCEEIGGDTYIVGGAVRDTIMNNPINDIDIATNVDIEDICNRFETHDIGKNKDFGIIVVKYMGEIFEVSHFRQDGIYSDNRRPDSVNLVNTIEEDLSRRDFTINAMAMKSDGTIIDLFGGQKDIEKGVIRFVGNAEDRIAKDGSNISKYFTPLFKLA